MKLEFLDDIDNHVKDQTAFSQQMIRLYDFNHIQAIKLKHSIQQNIIENKATLDLKGLDFIKGINCQLILRILENDLGIVKENNIYICYLTLKGYQNMIELIEPFCDKNTNINKYQWLYDIDTQTDFLFSPTGHW